MPIRTSPRNAISKAFDPAVLEAMQRMQATLDVLESSPAIVQRVNNNVVVN